MTLMDGATAGSGQNMRRPSSLEASPRFRTLRPRAGAAADRATLARASAETRAALEDAVVAAAVAADRARSMAAMLEEALETLGAAETKSAPAPARPRETWGRASALSPREREVLALVAEGRSNKAIAEALYVSPNTIKTHVASLLSKLHADTRVQLATIAARQVMA